MNQSNYFQLKPSESEIVTLGNKHHEAAQEEAKKLTSVILSVRHTHYLIVFLNFHAFLTLVTKPTVQVHPICTFI